MNEIFINNMKEKLLAQREAILASLSGHSNQMKDIVKPPVTGDEVDIASDTVDKTLLGSLSAQDAQLLKQIDNALERIRLDRYGVCLACGKEISEARLSALPYALMCINCATRDERRKR